MKQYHKIQSVFKRDKKGRMLFGEYSDPVFEYLKDNDWVFTEKVDGTNIRIMWDGNNVTFGGRTDNAMIPSFLVNRLSELFSTTTKKLLFKSTFPEGACFHGEGYGAKIQKGGGNYKSDGQDFVLFDIKVGDWWLKRPDVEAIAKSFKIDIVPIISDSGTLYDMVNMCKRGIISSWGNFPAEGIVAKPKIELQTRSGDRVIAKIKSKDFINTPFPVEA